MTTGDDRSDPHDLAGRRVLVTGGAGVIAGEMLQLLAQQGATVLSVDRLPLPIAPPPGVTHHVADLAEADLRPIADFGPSLVMHLAATFERSIETPEFWPQNWSDNVVATHRLLELAAGLGGVEAFVFASSYLIYRPDQYLLGEPAADGITLAETAAIGPRNLCGSAKLYGEAELEFAAEVLGGTFRTVSARIFRVYGRGSRDVVSRWVRAALRGDEIELYHPENRFDYIYSRDVADGLVRMALDGRAQGVINLGSGRSRTVGDVVTAIEAATERRMRVREGVVDEPYEASRADVTRLRHRLAWTPPTTLEAGVARLVEHEERMSA